MASSSSKISIKGVKWPEWSCDEFPASTIETSLFTHIYYAFLNPSHETYKFEISDQTAEKLKAFTSTLHSNKPTVNVLLSIGGWGVVGELAETYARMASSSSSRWDFINSSIKVARDYNFDGIDFDWEFPKNQAEMDQLGCLFHEWRAMIDTDAKGRTPLSLSASAFYRPECYDHDQLYPIESMNKNLDYINLMCYNYYGSWDTKTTGNHAALFNRKCKEISTSYGIESWIEKGAQKSKLIMGLPLFGRTFKLKDRNNHGIGDPAIGVGPGKDGYLPYKEIVNFNSSRNATVIYDENSQSTYSYVDSHWIGYDDERSIKKKLEFAKEKELGGYFFFAIGFDEHWQLSKAGA
ncbi:hypothetical protein HAX54_042980 [Datura stramonium]|uniref:GH18 domain-containing protein n=1 Tax=Datura stramonium TaxID=4076 RepID=A0ABS8SMT8_DATST|nr:hypothetical protein [Datura stramonium]